ncbi:MAG: zinc-binding alcohol dehydrogenase domain-containing 2-like [Trebouxia sp. A1-2]|nr:MAG: zinc-binding alcohol dehydrogenase domain-containing 2-like [Trebouxia sp. A1-2]
MKVDGTAALITGAGSGIGRHLALELAKQGCSKLTVKELNQIGCSAQALQCDVSDEQQQQEVFQRHLKEFGRLDIAILNAGIGDQGDIFNPQHDKWQKTLDVDLTAVMVGTRLAVQCMQAKKNPGLIITVASAAGIFPVAMAPVYATAKSGVVHFTRSVAPRLRKRNIRICALCPQQVDTPMTRHPEGAEMLKWMIQQSGGGVLTTQQVVDAANVLIQDDERVGTILLVMARHGMMEWVPAKQNLRPVSRAAGSAKVDSNKQALVQWASGNLPSHSKKAVNNFREATRVVSQALPSSIPAGHVLLRLAFAGVNASDVNFSSGRYHASVEQAQASLPFDAGFEAVGAVAAVGPQVSGLEVGQAVATLSGGCFADYIVVPAKLCLPAGTLQKEVVALLTSGLTASIGLEQAGRMRGGETVLVTAAAGGTGQFAVQLAKMAGNQVVATCGSDDKAQLLTDLGCDRVINYNKEQPKAVLKKEYPNGINIIYESVGGDMFKTCLGALGRQGRLVVIGMMSQYGAGWPQTPLKGVPEMLLYKSASLNGFFLIHYAHLFKKHLGQLASSMMQGQLKVNMDSAVFRGLDAVQDAVEHLQSGRSIGKVYVQIATDLPSHAKSRL